LFGWSSEWRQLAEPVLRWRVADGPTREFDSQPAGSGPTPLPRHSGEAVLATIAVAAEGPERSAADRIERALVVIPTYNERENIAKMIEAVLATDPRLDILVVDDGSPDGTGQIVEDIRLTSGRVDLLRRPRKMGLGTAYVAGFRWALQRGYGYVFEMDADFSHDPGHLPQFLKSVENADLVLGSRYQEGRVTVVNWPIARLILSYFANVYARFVTGLPVWDATGGFKCFRRKVLEAIDLSAVRSNGYAFQIEMSFRAWKKGFRIAEVPIVFVDRTEGTSKMSNAIVREAVWMVWRLRLMSILGKL
jgi:dolichol-phosphate mannosyltransferase